MAKCVNYQEQKYLCSYDLRLQPGTRIRQVEKYLDEIALSLQIPNRLALRVLNSQGLLRCEFIKPHREFVDFYQLTETVHEPIGNLMCLLGESYTGSPQWLELSEAPHLLIAGCSGSGKSTLLHTLIGNCLSYTNTQLVLMDPKSIEFGQYEEIADGTRVTIKYDYQSCLEYLQYLVEVMNHRYQKIRLNQVIDVDDPYIVVVIDEFADLIQQDVSKEFYQVLCTLAQKSRAAGIHIILSTQRPSADVVNGSIKANFPTRISCKVATSVDSRVILDATGAQNLMGHGDALIKNNTQELQRFQVAYCNPSMIIDQYLASMSALPHELMES